jgi:hypothetical protein
MSHIVLHRREAPMTSKSPAIIEDNHACRTA